MNLRLPSTSWARARIFFRGMRIHWGAWVHSWCCDVMRTFNKELDEEWLHHDYYEKLSRHLANSNRCHTSCPVEMHTTHCNRYCNTRREIRKTLTFAILKGCWGLLLLWNVDLGSLVSCCFIEYIESTWLVRSCLMISPFRLPHNAQLAKRASRCWQTTKPSKIGSLNR